MEESLVRIWYFVQFHQNIFQLYLHFQLIFVYISKELWITKELQGNSKERYVTLRSSKEL